ncbi:DUF885 domain-containing protein [Flavisolibacter sp. BT320]|nr:DUF885 domain-containing protein [Flavisolibacter longurius]
MRIGLLLGMFFFLCFTAKTQQKPVHKEIGSVLEEMRIYNQNAWKRDSNAGYVLGRFTEDGYREEYRFYKKLADKLSRIQKNTLSFDDQVNLDLLQHEVLDHLATGRFQSYLNPILSDWGFHTSLAGRANTSFRTKKDAEAYIRLLNDVPRYVAENLALMRKGLERGISQPKAILQGYETTYRQHIVDTVERSVFWKPFAQKPTGIADDDWKDLQTAAKIAIRKNVIQAYRSIDAFFTNEYLPKTRTTLGASHFPEGTAFYEDRVRHYTTTSMTAEEVYAVGLKEVDRIKRAMDSVLRVVNFTGTLQEFIAYLRTDPKFYPKTGDDLLKEASFIAKKVDGKLPSLFGKLPRQPYTVTAVPDYLAPSFTTGRYSSAPINSTRPGEYWVNTYNLPSRTLYTLEALTLHESVPGHHLQIALAQELSHLPEFRRRLYINAFGEGWGLYSEYLGHEMGFYKDPYSLFGRLTYDMWRACRLVIDVGIHLKGWTREEAVRYLADHTALSLHEVNTEVNRYISWPGQALAYKIGEIKIKELRQKAEAELKEDFDVRSFHDMLHSNGSVTLSVLEKMTERFIREQKAKRKKPELVLHRKCGKLVRLPFWKTKSAILHV